MGKKQETLCNILNGIKGPKPRLSYAKLKKKGYFDEIRQIYKRLGGMLTDFPINVGNFDIGMHDLFVELDEDAKSSSNSRSAIKKEKHDFESIWENYIVPLEGKTLIRGSGKSNKILRVDWSGVVRLTSNWKRQTIKIEAFRKVINHLLDKGTITRAAINEEYVGRASSGIALILSQVPFFEHENNPERLIYKSEPE